MLHTRLSTQIRPSGQLEREAPRVAEGAKDEHIERGMCREGSCAVQLGHGATTMH